MRLKERMHDAALRLRDRVLLGDGVPGALRVRTRREEAITPFFVVGHPRSGTTLLRTILTQHPDIFIPPENGRLWQMIRVFGGARWRSWPEAVDRVLEEFRQGYEFEQWQRALPALPELRERLVSLPSGERSLADLFDVLYRSYGEVVAPGKQLWGDKTTPGDFRHLDKLNRVFPDARYVHIIRDGRDCVVSCVEAGFYSGSHVEAARAWRDNVRDCEAIGRDEGDRRTLFQLRYEDLTGEAGPVVEQLCRYLGVSATQEMLQHHRGARTSAPDVAALSHHANVARPIFSSSVGRWRAALPEGVRDAVQAAMAADLARLGYD